MFRKELLTKVHNFIHLNLSISLLLGYVVFLSGVETAVANKVSSRNYAVLYIACVVYLKTLTDVYVEIQKFVSKPYNYVYVNCNNYYLLLIAFASFASAYGITKIRSQIYLMHVSIYFYDITILT